jgi:hypothetical protein
MLISQVDRKAIFRVPRLVRPAIPRRFQSSVASIHVCRMQFLEVVLAPLTLTYIRFHLHLEEESGFLETYRSATGCLDEDLLGIRYELSRSRERNANFILRIEYQHDQLEPGRFHTAVNSFLSSMGGYRKSAVEVSSYEPVSQ